MNKTQQDTTNVDHLLRQQTQWDQLDNQKVLARRCGYNKSSWGRALMQAAQLPREQQNLTEPTTTVALQSSAITSSLLYDSDMTDLVLRQLSPDHMYCAALVCRGFADLARSICPTGWETGSAGVLSSEGRCKWALSVWPKELRVMLWLWHPSTALAPAGQNLQTLDEKVIKKLVSGAGTAGLVTAQDVLPSTDGHARSEESKQRDLIILSRTVVSNWLRPADIRAKRYGAPSRNQTDIRATRK